MKKWQINNGHTTYPLRLRAKITVRTILPAAPQTNDCGTHSGFAHGATKEKYLARCRRAVRHNAPLQSGYVIQRITNKK
jgi:hypothetical protein